MEYTIKYELDVNGETIKDTMAVEAEDEQSAVAFAGQTLQDEWEDNTVLLSCKVVGHAQD